MECKGCEYDKDCVAVIDKEASVVISLHADMYERIEEVGVVVKDIVKCKFGVYRIGPLYSRMQ